MLTFLHELFTQQAHNDETTSILDFESTLNQRWLSAGYILSIALDKAQFSIFFHSSASTRQNTLRKHAYSNI